MTKPTLSNITLGERLVIIRRRLGITQRGLAEYLGLPRRAVQELEADTYAGTPGRLVEDFASVNELKQHERCYLARRRAGTEVQQLASDMGISRQWLNEMESGRQACGPLYAYWNF